MVINCLVCSLFCSLFWFLIWFLQGDILSSHVWAVKFMVKAHKQEVMK